MAQKSVRVSMGSTRGPEVTGRYRGFHRNQRVCLLCNNNHCGDANHILFECKHAIIMDGKKYLPYYTSISMSMVKNIL